MTFRTVDSSSLGRYVFGSEISYNKAPPPPAWAALVGPVQNTISSLSSADQAVVPRHLSLTKCLG